MAALEVELNLNSTDRRNLAAFGPQLERVEVVDIFVLLEVARGHIPVSGVAVVYYNWEDSYIEVLEDKAKRDLPLYRYLAAYLLQNLSLYFEKRNFLFDVVACVSFEGGNCACRKQDQELGGSVCRRFCRRPLSLIR